MIALLGCRGDREDQPVRVLLRGIKDLAEARLVARDLMGADGDLSELVVLEEVGVIRRPQPPLPEFVPVPAPAPRTPPPGEG